jgi:hypothetical protein
VKNKNCKPFCSRECVKSASPLTEDFFGFLKAPLFGGLKSRRRWPRHEPIVVSQNQFFGACSNVHANYLVNADALRKDQRVSFEVVSDDRRGKPRADQVRVI